MGIKQLHTFIKKYLKKNYNLKDVYKEISMEHFRDKTIAIDVSIFMYKFKYKLQENWLYGFYDMIQCFQNYGIKIIMVLDGSTLPAKKLEHEKRRKQQQKMKDDIDKLEEKLRDYIENNNIHPELLELQKKNKSKVNILLKPIQEKDKKTIDIEMIEYILNKKKSQIIKIKKKDFDLLKELLDICQIPCIVAKHEAEALCSQLCISKKVDAVLTEDTDVLAYGTPCFIYKLNTLRGIFYYLEMETILKYLDITFNQFQDFCIMCGTDYNTNINKIGPVNSFKLIKEHKSLDIICDILEKKKKDTSVLQYKLCRSIFCNKEKQEIKCNTDNIYSIKDKLRWEEFKFKYNI